MKTENPHSTLRLRSAENRSPNVAEAGIRGKCRSLRSAAEAAAPVGMTSVARDEEIFIHMGAPWAHRHSGL